MSCEVPAHCPFCQSQRTKVIKKTLRVESYYGKPAAYVFCQHCKARGPLVTLCGETTIDVRNECLNASGERELELRAIESWNVVQTQVVYNPPRLDDLPLFVKNEKTKGEENGK